MTTFYAICAALACIAWISAEARIRTLETRIERVMRQIRQQRANEFAKSRPSFRYAADHIIDRILNDIDHVGSLHIVDGEDAA